MKHNLSEAAIQALGRHSWPGNVRELANAVERACILSDTMILEPKDLGLNTEPLDERHVPNAVDLSGSLSEVTNRALRIVEYSKIAEALKLNDGNKAKTAEDLGISYKTLLTKIRDYNL